MPHNLLPHVITLVADAADHDHGGDHAAAILISMTTPVKRPWGQGGIGSLGKKEPPQDVKDVNGPGLALDSD
jgi:hypothetical protein